MLIFRYFVVESHEVFVWHIFTNPYSYPFILYVMSFSILFINSYSEDINKQH